MDLKLSPISPLRQILTFGDTKSSTCKRNKERIYWIDSKQYLIVSTGFSYKVISLPDFKTKFFGPTFSEQIRAIDVFNEFVFAGFESKILKLHFSHLVAEFDFAENEISEGLRSMKIFTKFLVVGLDSEIRVFDSADFELLRVIGVGFPVNFLEHPLSYKNKVLVGDGRHLALVNIGSGKKVYSFNDDAGIHQILSKVGKNYLKFINLGC